MSRKRGEGDEEKENEEGTIDLPPAANSTTLTTVSTVPATTDQFMHTPEFSRHFVEFVPVDALMALRLATKGWNTAVDALIDEIVRSGAIIVHDENDISEDLAEFREERRELVTRVILFLDISQVGDFACLYAVNLVVVDIPEGFECIGWGAFCGCYSLTAVSFPTTLISIGEAAFRDCYSLDNVDLLHINLQELGEYAFMCCSELKSMTIPDSLQTLGRDVFGHCSKLVPSNINVKDAGAVVAHFRSDAYARTRRLQKRLQRKEKTK